MSDPTPKTTKLLTVGELRKRLETLPDNALVGLLCDDSFYSGLVDFETKVGKAALYGPYDYQTPNEDAYGRAVQPQTRTHSGGWVIIEDDYHDLSVLADKPVLEHRVAFVFSSGMD